ncbi:unnamed protein product [Clavelina lepadiformis]|uniref:Uncharacterized protein n=1 Tax=Clavelina lepadiformis TaxID=159417 RepID=A0ABP0GJS6_CLALP
MLNVRWKCNYFRYVAVALVILYLFCQLSRTGNERTFLREICRDFSQQKLSLDKDAGFKLNQKQRTVL